MDPKYAAPMLHMSVIESPVGPLTLAARGDRLCALHFGNVRDDLAQALLGADPAGQIVTGDPAGATTALRAYFDGDLDALDRVQVEPTGTPFQLRVWSSLRAVRGGRTASYADIARTIGAPAAVRAVGAANGANPIAIVVPCHRIIGSSGSLTGYGGGLDRKRWLLEHEGVLLRIAR
jgi:methylated-DNA-[protein]-cysteine S-methyltransferase